MELARLTPLRNEMRFAFENCLVFDGSSADLLDDVCVIVDGARIVDVARITPANCDHRVNCGRRILMPGLIDAHVHVCSPSFSFFQNDRLPPSLLAVYGSTTLQGMLARGFTTVRDAGGGDRGLWMAIERGLIKGPRFLYSGRAISQTGGHGDMRSADQHEPCGCSHYSGSISAVADGADGVRQAVREQLRRGAHQIKVFVSGGVTSPSDPLWMNQFTDDEIRAAVEEAATRRTYVMAHAHTDEAIRRCIRLGVRSIEHGSQVEPDTAKQLVETNTYVVPTLVVADIAKRHGHDLGMPDSAMEKLDGVFERMSSSIRACAGAGVRLGLGSDILGFEFQSQQGRELTLRAEVQAPLDVLRSATSVNAELLRRPGELGCIAPGAYADLIVLEGNPFMNMALFEQPLKNIALVMKAGEIIRNSL